MNLSAKTITDATYDRVRSDILSGVYRPGERLLETELAESLGVSRTPVRDALLRLQQDGLATIKPHRGVFVRKLSRKDIQDFYQVRTVLEGLGAKLATRNIQDESRIKLEGLMKEMEYSMNMHNESQNYKQIAEVNDKFHSLIFQMADNQVLEQMRQTLLNPIGLVRMTSWLNKDRKMEVFNEHEEIAKAILNHDAEDAKEKVEKHIINAGKSADLNLDHLLD